VLDRGKERFTGSVIKIIIIIIIAVNIAEVAIKFLQDIAVTQSNTDRAIPFIANFLQYMLAENY